MASLMHRFSSLTARTQRPIINSLLNFRQVHVLQKKDIRMAGRAKKYGNLAALALGGLAVAGGGVALCETKWGAEYDPDNHGPYFPENYEKIKIIGGNGNKKLAEEVAEALGINLMKSRTAQYADGEVMVQLDENVRGKDIYVVQSCAAPVNVAIMELLLTCSAVARASAKRVTAVIPYFAYKHHRRGAPISTGLKSRFLWSASSDFAKMLEVVGVDRVIAVDLQRPGQGHEACFFSPQIPVETIMTTEMAAKYMAKRMHFPRPVCVVAPNSETIKKARKFELKFRKRVLVPTSLGAFLPKQASSGPVAPTSKAFEFMGDVEGKDVVIVEDLVDTGATCVEMARQLRAAGAADIYVCASHGLFGPGSIERLRESGVKKVVVLNTLPLPEGQDWQGMVEQIPIGKWLAQLIKTEHLRSNDFDDDLEDEDAEDMREL
mmetsp:Transcript_4342/g.7736  ORF Transcript_4342/g.7736 Transcript_4342/m.7736 type:complete len:435 (+) Transcript_4342:74-1378(+)